MLPDATALSLYFCKETSVKVSVGITVGYLQRSQRACFPNHSIVLCSPAGHMGRLVDPTVRQEARSTQTRPVHLKHVHPFSLRPMRPGLR